MEHYRPLASHAMNTVIEDRLVMATGADFTRATLRDANDSDDDEIKEKVVKMVVMGDGTSGKTSVCSRFAKKSFDEKYVQTVGVDFYSRHIVLPSNVPVLIQLWDIGGQSLAANMLKNYLFDAQGIIFIYDVVNSTTFDNLNDWIDTVKRILRSTERPVKPPVFALIGNKTDLEHRRTVRIDRHNKLAEKTGMLAFYTSAKTGDSVDFAFRQIAAAILGVQLSKTDMEADISVVRAPVTISETVEPKSKPTVEVVQPNSVKDSLPTPLNNPKKLNDSDRQSSVCSLQ